MIKIENLKKSYGSGESRNEVLKNISLHIKEGDFVVILGASGSGKSTLLNVVSGLEPADSGNIFYKDTNLTALTDKELTSFRKENIGFIFQQYFLLPNLNVDKNVKMGADLAANKQYREIIDAVGLGEKLSKYPHELSGGEQQRVSVARALAKKPKILYLDEPTGQYKLVVKNYKKIIRMFFSLSKRISRMMDRHSSRFSGIEKEPYTLSKSFFKNSCRYDKSFTGRESSALSFSS